MAPYSHLMFRELELPVEVMDTFLDIIVILQMVGFVGCTLTLGTVLFSKVYRRPTWLSFMLTWTVSGMSYLLLFLSGQLENPDPPFGICITQASLIYAVPLLTAASTLALVAQVYLEVRSLFIERVRQHERMWNVILLSVPYLLFLGMATGGLMVGLNDPSTVHRGSLATPYCNMTNRIPSKIASIAVAALLLPTLVLEGRICWVFKNNWSVIRGRQSLISTAIRVLGFSILGMLAIALSLVFAATNDRSPAMNVMISFMPIAAFLLFGTQWDIIGVWMFWKKTELSSVRNTISSENELSELVGKAPQNP